MTKPDLSAAAFNPSNSELVAEIKSAVNDLAAVIDKLPPSRRKSIAITHLETASMFAVKANFEPD